MAAGQAALEGAHVTLMEKMDRPLNKLRITGNGRCNLTNTAPIEEAIVHFGRNGKFLRTAFSQFYSSELIRFFNNLYVRTSNDKRGRIYPTSNSADDVAEALLNWANKCGALINTQASVKKIITEKNHIVGVQLSEKKAISPANAVVIATGGASYPATGSTGDGYHLAKSLGHRVIEIRPASVPLVTAGELAPKLQGISLENVSITIKSGGEKALKAKGDMLFTHYGVSGPLILTISRFCVDKLHSGILPILSIDLAPNYDEKQLDQILIQSLNMHGKSKIQTILKDFIPLKLASAILSILDILPEKSCTQISADERRKIGHELKKFEFQITGHRPLREAMVTAGGVALNEIDPRTMESRLIQGLYFAGEVIDLDADTGGYNLQAAFSTGWLAGQSCTTQEH
jgi:predicted Rossmann fold flavoprotein